jgi:hypothetical protein
MPIRSKKCVNAQGIGTSWIIDAYQKHSLTIHKFTQPVSYVQERGQTRSTPKKPKEAVQTCHITLKSIVTRTQTLHNLTLNETFSTRAAAVLYPGLSAMLSVKTASKTGCALSNRRYQQFNGSFFSLTNVRPCGARCAPLRGTAPRRTGGL